MLTRNQRVAGDFVIAAFAIQSAPFTETALWSWVVFLFFLIAFVFWAYGSLA